MSNIKNKILTAIVSLPVVGGIALMAFPALAYEVPSVTPATMSATDSLNIGYGLGNIVLDYLKQFLPWALGIALGLAMLYFAVRYVFSFLRR